MAGILSDGEIRSNRDGKFEFLFSQSENSFGRRHGYVCLFDLRCKSDLTIENALRKCYFLSPNGQDTVIYLIVGSDSYKNLIPNCRAQEEASKEVWVPEVEAWCPEPIFLDQISNIIEVEIVNKADSSMARIRKILFDKTKIDF